MKGTIEMGSSDMICIQSSVKIGTGVQAIIRFCFRNLGECDVDITSVRDLRIAPLK
jgi:hypothetical protein